MLRTLTRMSIPHPGAWALLAGLAVSSLQGCAPALNWREVRPDAAQGFVALFPCQPDHVQRTVELPGLPGTVSMHVHACQAGGVQWSLTHLDAGTVERRAAALPALVRALWANLSADEPASARRESLGPLSVKGATPHVDAQAWWLQGRRPLPQGASEPVRAQAWYFSKGTVVFQASAWAPSLRNDDPRLKAFAEGFNFPP